MKKVEISIYAQEEFKVDKTMPRTSFQAKGFNFVANIRSRSAGNYLSSIVVSDQKFIKGDSAQGIKDDSPDLRVNVNNPFIGKRFSENDILFLDKQRLYQTRAGNFNITRFDRLMEDFNYLYLKGKEGNIVNLNDDLDTKIRNDQVKK